jgi:hypothetical protein
MPRGSVLQPNERTKAVRIRAPEVIIRKLERFTPAQLGAWVYHNDARSRAEAPELSLDQTPPPIPENAVQEKPVNPRLVEILKHAKPVTAQDLQNMRNALQFTDEERAADEAFWQEREQERQRERELLMRKLEDNVL